MGKDIANSVVDANLKVHGINSLRVVDASVFPNQVSGHPCAVVIAVAEKAADVIKAASWFFSCLRSYEYGMYLWLIKCSLILGGAPFTQYHQYLWYRFASPVSPDRSEMWATSSSDDVVLPMSGLWLLSHKSHINLRQTWLTIQPSWSTGRMPL